MQCTTCAKCAKALNRLNGFMTLILVILTMILVAMTLVLVFLGLPSIKEISKNVDAIEGRSRTDERLKLIQKIEQARGYALIGGIANEDKALQIFHEVTAALSPESRKYFDDADLLSQAENDIRNHYNDDALRRYLAAFSPDKLGGWGGEQ